MLMWFQRRRYRDFLRCSSSKKYGDKIPGGADIAWGPLPSFMGARVIYNRSTRILAMDVEQKIIDIFKYHPSLEKIPIHWTPLATKGSSPGTPSATIQRYVNDHFATIVGGLTYLVVSCRPDLAQAVGVLARYMHGPTPEAVVGCIHCCGYIKIHLFNA